MCDLVLEQSHEAQPDDLKLLLLLQGHCGNPVRPGHTHGHTDTRTHTHTHTHTHTPVVKVTNGGKGIRVNIMVRASVESERGESERGESERGE